MRYTIFVLAIQFTLGAGFGGAAVWLAMRRRRRQPYLDVLHQVAKVTGIPFADLVRDHEEPPRAD